MNAHSLGLLCFALTTGIVIAGCGGGGGSDGGNEDAGGRGGSGGSGGKGGTGGGNQVPETGGEDADLDDGSDDTSDSSPDVTPDTPEDSISCLSTESVCGTECCNNATHLCKNNVCEQRPCDVGSACGPGMVCKAPLECVDGCLISDSFYEHGAVNAANECETCTAANTSGWSSNTGAMCETGKVCNASRQCVEGCVIGGVYYESGTPNPANKCQRCASASQTDWTNNGSVGANCGEVGETKYCNASDACIEGCKIGSVVVEFDAPNPTNDCQLCKAETPLGWTLAEEGKPCGGIAGAACNASGVCAKPPMLSASREHTCAVSPIGNAFCWGYNASYRLGDGSTTDRTSPVAVSGGAVGTTGGLKSIVTGAAHGCFLTLAGAVKCWGSNEYGQIGNGGTTTPSTPQQVTGLTAGVIAISAGGSHSCAVTADGAAKCWGYNANGQLGDGTTVNRTSPVSVAGMESNVKMIAAGSDHTCAITSSGGLKCWGGGHYGQLGIGTTDNSAQPAQVLGMLTGVEQVSLGQYFTCALLTSGAVKCWGYNSSGKLGTGAIETLYSPTQVIGLTSGVAAISAGSNHTCALTNAGEMKCWGLNNGGQLGNGTKTTALSPVFVTDLTSDVVRISSGGSHTCAAKADRTTWCWGEGTYGKLGNGTTTERLTPYKVNSF